MNMQTNSAPDFAAIKTRQQAAWSAGDYAVVGTTLQIVGEMLCEAIDLRGGQRGVAVACGDVEHALVGLQVAGLGELLADELQRGADHGVVAGAPGSLLAGLHGGEVNGCVHGVLR